MTHPTNEQLYAWLDGETDAFARARDTVAHVERCARCQRVLEGGRQLGDALRRWSETSAPAPGYDLASAVMLEASPLAGALHAWAEDCAPHSAGDLAGRVMLEGDTRFGNALRAWAQDRAPAAEGDLAGRVMLEADGLVGGAIRAWADDSAPAPAGDIADWVFRAAEAQPVAPVIAEKTVVAAPMATVTPIGSRRRKWLWATGPAALAAAAALVFAIARPGAHTNTRRTPRTNHTAVTTHGDANVTPRAPEPSQLAVAPAGSSVLSISNAGDDATYSVIELPGEHEGETVAVVWEDESGNSTKLKS